MAKTAEADAVATKVFGGRSAGEMRSKNEDSFQPRVQEFRYHKDGEVYLFSTAKREFRVSQTLFPDLVLKGCTNGERYVLAAVIPDPVPQASPDQERGGRRYDYHDGYQAAMGILNSEIPEGVGDWKKAAEMGTMSDGVNLFAQGLFPSRVNPPWEEDTRFAESVRDKRYRRLTDQAMRAAATSQKALSDFLRMHEDVHDAMDALGLQADWHRRREVLGKCPNCGDEIPPSVAFHKSSVGVLCVIDPVRAYKAGAIDKERYEELATAPAV